MPDDLEPGLKPDDGEHELLVIFFIILFFALLCGLIWRGGFILWSQPPKYSTGVTTNAADVSFGSGLPAGNYIGQDWTAQPFG